MEQIVFNNPFLTQAHWYEEPLTAIQDHWITKEYGLEVFQSGNKADRWIYIKAANDSLLKATPEFIEDKEVAKLVFSKIGKEVNL